VRWAPRRWPGPARPWLDLANGELRTGKESLEEERQRGSSSRAVLFELGAGPLDDLLYLPVVSPAFASAREALAHEYLTAGAPILLQVLASDELPQLASESGLLVVLDLLDPLLRGDLAALDRAPAGVIAAWPLLPGLTDDPALWEEGCARLAAAGIRQAQAVTVRLSPQDRRWLAERRPAASFDALFHRDPPPERAFDQVAHRHGLAPFPARPLPRAPRAVRSNRRLAGALALAAELWLRLGRPVGQGEALYRAARFADRAEHDLAALAREGNLALLDWLDPLGRDVVLEAAKAGTSTLVEELFAEYLEPPRPDPSLR
jgi:hypothetical protein